MKVKNGIASSRSLDRMPKMRAAAGRLQEGGGEEAELDRDEAEEQAERGEREGHREADQHEHDQPAEHQRRHQFELGIIASAARIRERFDRLVSQRRAGPRCA